LDLNKGSEKENIKDEYADGKQGNLFNGLEMSRKCLKS
jgi:hypothetical protein